MENKTCPVCENIFLSRREDAVYCSPACRQKAYRQRRPRAKTGDPYLLICSVCSHEYLAYRSDSRFCSQTCRSHAGHQRKGRRLDYPIPEPEDWRRGPTADWLDQVKRSGEFWDGRSFLRD